LQFEAASFVSTHFNRYMDIQKDINIAFPRKSREQGIAGAVHIVG
jgi:hypothetical protein